MMQDKWTRLWRFVAAIAMAFSLFATTLAGIAVWSTPAEEPVARGYQTKCYSTDGGDKWVCVDGGEIELQTGATLDVQSGAGIAADALNVSTLVVTTTSDLRGNVSSGVGAVTVTDSLLVDGAADIDQVTIQGYSTQTNNLLLLEQSDGTDKLTVNNEGQVATSAEPDSDATSYDYMFRIHYSMTGTGTKDRNYGLYIDGTRAAGQEVTSGDHNEAGLKLRVDTEAVTTTVGTVLRGIDVEAKADNPDGTVYNLYGASLTAKSDTNAGPVDTMIALQTNVQNNALVTTTLISADFRLMRQAATAPTTEYVVKIRNSSTSGTGADAGIYFDSDYGTSATTDSFDYGIDFSGAAINTAEIRGENGETINNTTDTAWAIGGFLGLEEGAVVDLGATFTLTPAASYQPVTNSTGGSITSSATTAIADGPIAGAILIIINEDAQDIVFKDGANTQFGGDITLTGGADDSMTLLWDGTDWTMLSMHDN